MPIPLHGGRYDGMAFNADDSWEPGPDVGVLYLGRTPAETPPPGFQGIMTTAHAGVPFAARTKHDPFDPTWHNAEVYLRCKDGSFRTPKLAAEVL